MGDRGALPPSSAVSAAELEADRWVLLRAATPAWVWCWRALALVLLALLVTGVALDGELASGPRSPWERTALVVGLLMAVSGTAWLWRAATLPRSIDSEVYRLGLTAYSREDRRRVVRALLRGGPLHGLERPAAAAYAAAQRTYLFHPGLWLSVGGMLVTMADSPSADLLQRAVAVMYVVLVAGWLATAWRAHRVQRAAAAAGVPPRLADAPV